MKIYTGPPVLCQAIVDWIPSEAPLPKEQAAYRVRVWGRPGGPHDFKREYDIVARTEGLAAQEGLRRFTVEAEGLHDVAGAQPAAEPAPNRH
jgi:hypothetical protein